MNKPFDNPDVKNFIPGPDSFRNRQEGGRFWEGLQKYDIDEEAAIEAARKKAQEQGIESAKEKDE